MDLTGDTIGMSEVGKGMEVKNLAYQLIWFDSNLREYAIKKIKEQIARYKYVTNAKGQYT